jgi:hypothetical protein
MHNFSSLLNHGSTSRRAAAFVAAALSCSLSAGPAEAQSPNQIVSPCELDPTTVSALETKVGAVSGSSTPTDDFVVIYSLANPNDGQAVSGGFTGPVLCGRPGVSVVEQTGGGTDAIPGTVNLRDTETALITQYLTAGQIRKRFCHSVGVNSDCFVIQSSPSPD